MIIERVVIEQLSAEQVLGILHVTLVVGDGPAGTTHGLSENVLTNLWDMTKGIS